MLYTQTPLLRSAPVKESPTKGTTALLLNCNEKSIYQVIHNVNTPMSHNIFKYYAISFSSRQSCIVKKDLYTSKRNVFRKQNNPSNHLI